MKWTAAQRAAIETDGCNLLVSAAAGSGKTAVLTERIVRLVREGTEIERFLIVTFTDAATAEMKRRIAARLYEAAQEEQELAQATRLREQALMASRANISTLHAFCLYILRRNFHLLGLDPNFHTADSLLSGMLKEQAIQQCAEHRYEKNDEQFLVLLRAMGGKEEALFSATRRLYEFVMAQPAPFAWLMQAATAYDTEEAALNAHPAMHAVHVRLQAQAAAQTEVLLRARGAVPEGKPAVLALLDDDLAQLRALQLSRSLGAFRERLLAISFRRFSWPGRDMPREKAVVKQLRDSARTAIHAMGKLLSRDMEAEAAAMRALQPQVNALCGFLREFHEAYQLAKQERGVVDFADMEHMALRALRAPAVRETLRQRFTYIFVDEYQDSSHIQEHLIQQIRQENALFLVGDVKQSIYRFRQADPGLFLQKQRRYTAGEGRVIHLNCNFRSARPVIDAVNDVFSRILSEQTGGIAYDADAALQLPESGGDTGGDDVSDTNGKDTSGIDVLCGCELHLIERKLEENAGDTPDALADAAEVQDAEAEAMLAAARIRALMKSSPYHDAKTGETRRLRYADFTVLLRAQRPVAQAWAQTLSKLGIPAYVQLAGGYFDAIEVQVFLNLLRVIDNKRQDIPLLSVLRSPVFNFSLEDLVLLKTTYEADSLYERLELCADGTGGTANADADNGDTIDADADGKAATSANAAEPLTLARRARQVFVRLSAWREEQLLQPLHTFIAQLLDETGFYDCVGALPAGQERQANLDALLTRAEEYANSGGANDLWSFLNYMDGAASTAQLGAAQAGAADVVRVLSMHAAKGLEYPVVFLAGLGRRFAFLTMERQENVQASRELGLGVRFVREHTRQDTLLRRAITEHAQSQQLAEEMRILYVGMTRARSRLILIGCMKGAEEALEQPNAALTPAYCATASHYLDWLVPVAREASSLPITLHARASVLAQAAQAMPEKQAQNKPDAALLAETLSQLQTHFSWQYPHTLATQIPTKRSVSELTQPQPHSLREAPAFVQSGEALTPLQRGEAAHAVLRELRLAACGQGQEPAFLQEELARFIQTGLLTKRQAGAVQQKSLLWFLTSGLGKRLRAARRVERELEFSIELPASELLPTSSTEPVLLQGVIDCCFLEGDAWVLLDYKTDHVQRDISAIEAANAHATQLSFYAKALHTLTGKPVKERYAVLLAYCEAVEV